MAELESRLADLERKNRQLLSEKTSVEDQRREIEADRTRRQGFDTEDARLKSEALEVNRRMAKVRRDAEDGDYQAQTILDGLELQQRAIDWNRQQLATMRAEMELARIPEDRRDEVRTLITERRAASVSDADDIVLGRRHREEQSRRASKAREGGDDGERVVRTTVRGVSAGEHKDRTIAAEEAEKEVERLLAAGQKDKARDLMRRLDAGEMKYAG